jgi:hypothetical protein
MSALRKTDLDATNAREQPGDYEATGRICPTPLCLSHGGST